MAQRVKSPPTMQETRILSLGWEDPLEKRMVTYSSILAWRIPWTEDSLAATVRGVAESDTTEHAWRVHLLGFPGGAGGEGPTDHW